MNPLRSLQGYGQAAWLDFVARRFIAEGDLKKLIDEDGLRGVTSNPAIFEKAIGHGEDYDGSLRPLRRRRRDRSRRARGRRGQACLEWEERGCNSESSVSAGWVPISPVG